MSPPPGERPGLLGAVGQTALVELFPDPVLPRGVRLFAKLETQNPGGSIKDRPVSRILTQALASGELPPGRRVLDSSSGNAGIAYAMIGAALDLPVTLVIPGNASRERLERIAAHGAELILTDPVEGYDHALREVRRLASAEPERYWFADQYGNEHNWRAHYETTGPEILQQVHRATGAAPDLFVAGVGTGGTITGVGRLLKQEAPGVSIAAIMPDRFPGIEGLKPLGEPDDIVPEILDASIVDCWIDVEAEHAAEAALRLARRGLFVGVSSGGYVHAALDLARTGEYRTVVTVLNDTGERYGSTELWRRGGVASREVAGR